MVVLSNVIAALTFFLMPADTALFNAQFDPVVTLPAGYFLMRSDEDAPDGYVAVIYDDLSGFVRLSDVNPVDYTPVTKYETSARFRCDNDGQPVNLRSAPYKSADVVKVLGANASGRVYGTADGDALIKNGDTLWYYVSIDGVRGYCYYAHISADEPLPNIIEKEPTEDPSNPSAAEPVSSEEKTPMPTAAIIVLIVSLCVPVPFIMFYMFRKPKNKQ